MKMRASLSYWATATADICFDWFGLLTSLNYSIDLNDGKSKKGFGRRTDLTFIRFGFLHQGMRFKHYLHYLKGKENKIKGHLSSIKHIKMMPCNKALYIKRKRNKA